MNYAEYLAETLEMVARGVEGAKGEEYVPTPKALKWAAEKENKPVEK